MLKLGINSDDLRVFEVLNLSLRVAECIAEDLLCMLTESRRLGHVSMVQVVEPHWELGVLERLATVFDRI